MNPQILETIFNRDPDLGKEEIRKTLGMQRLATLIGLKSIDRTMKVEEDAIEQENDDVRNVLHNPCGDNPVAQKKQAGEDMRDVTSAGDVHFHSEQPATNKLLTAGLIALGLGAGLALPIIAWNMTRDSESAEVESPEFTARFVPVEQQK